MRNISFALTTPQFLAQTKTVTRRMGWAKLNIGEVLCGVRKSQGLKKGERVEKLGRILVISVRREMLRRMTDDEDYGEEEVHKEGFPHYTPGGFVAMFCASHGCTPDATVTRIEYGYVASCLP